MKKALVFFFAVVIGMSFAFTGFAQEKKATPATPAAKVETPAPADEQPVKKEKTKKTKKVKKTKKAPKKAAGAPSEEKPAETK